MLVITANIANPAKSEVMPHSSKIEERKKAHDWYLIRSVIELPLNPRCHFHDDKKWS
jgi:hypothetical protein